MSLSSKDTLEFEKCFSKVLEIVGKFQDVFEHLRQTLFKLYAPGVCTSKYVLDLDGHRMSIKEDDAYIVLNVALDDIDVYTVEEILNKGEVLLELLEEFVKTKEECVRDLRRIYEDLREALEPIAVAKKLKS
jgi:hypothetical protein